jgi:hypothetical protein
VASTFLRRNRLLEFQPPVSSVYRRKRRKPKLLRQAVRHLNLQKSGGWLLALLMASGLFLWDEKLLLATVSGLSIMGLIYGMQQAKWRQRWLPLYKLVMAFSTVRIATPSRQLILAVGGGMLAVFSTYLAAAVWADASSPWVATGAILQGGGTLAVLLLLVGQYIQRRADRKDVAFSQYLTDLTHNDPLKRLVAVKQLNRCLQRSSLDDGDRAAIADCFRLMVGQEQEPAVQDAIFDGLQLCDRLLEPVAPQSLKPLPPLARKKLG